MLLSIGSDGPRACLPAGQGRGWRVFLRAPDDAPDVIAFPVPAARVERRARLAGLMNEYRQSA